MTRHTVRLKGPCHTCRERDTPGTHDDIIKIDHDDEGHPMLVIEEVDGKPARVIPNCHKLPHMELIDEDGSIWIAEETGWTRKRKPDDRATPA